MPICSTQAMMMVENILLTETFESQQLYFQFCNHLLFAKLQKFKRQVALFLLCQLQQII